MNKIFHGLSGEEVSDESSDNDVDDDAPADSEMEEDDAEDSNLFKYVLDHVEKDSEDGEDAWVDDEMQEPSKQDVKGKGKAQPEKVSARHGGKQRKGAEITKWLSKRYMRKATAARAEGGDHFQQWAEGIIRKGYEAVTTLRQRTMNDKTRVKALEEMLPVLNAFVSLLGL